MRKRVAFAKQEKSPSWNQSSQRA